MSPEGKTQRGLDGDEADVAPPIDEDRGERLANGPIYLIVDWLMRVAYKASLVERLKQLTFWALNTCNDDKRRVANWVIDLFVVAKWMLVLVLWAFDISHWTVVILVAYLVLWNSLTYFHYHLWIVEDPKRGGGSHHRERRRFVSLVLAMAYSMVSFAYLYHRVDPSGFEWPDSTPRWISSITYSIGNALTSQAGGLHPIDGAAYLLGATQLVFTFGFVAMLLSNSLPRVKP